MRIHAIMLTTLAASSLAILALTSACDDRGAAPAPAPTTTAPADEPDGAAAPEDYFDELGDDVDLENAEETLDGIRQELEAEEADGG